MNRKMNVAILGAGKIAKSMATALNGIKDEINLYAVASRNIDKARQFAETFGFMNAYGSYEELALDESVDLIYVATPHSEHYKNAKLCLENGRNVLVEKAFCANMTQAKEIIELARKKHLLLAEAMWTRYQPSKDIIAGILKSGRIGKIHYLESDFSVPINGVERLVNPALAGGSLLDLGVYSLTVAAMYLGTDICKVKLETVKTETGVDETMTVTLTYADGTMAKAKCSSVDERSNFARIVGDKGYIEFGPINVPEKVCIYDIDGNLIEEMDMPIMVNGYEYQVLECKASIGAGKVENDSMPHSETLRMMGWMDSLRYHAGIVYPFENEEDVRHDDELIWGNPHVFDDSDPWDRSNTKSFLEIYDIETDSRQVLASFDKVIEAPNWSSDGKFLVYNSEGLIYRFDLDTKISKQIPSGKLHKMNNDHVLRSDDNAIAVSDESSEDGKSRIYIIPFDGSEPKLVTKNGPSYLHGWSSDMKHLCYCAERGGEYDVYEIDIDGQAEKRLTTAPRLNDGCEYDKCDEYIYFNSVRSGLMQAWKMKRDGSEQTQLTYDENLNTWFPHISPDRSKIVMVSYRKGDLWPGDHVPNKDVEIRCMNADGTGLKTLFSLFGGQGTINVNSWSPDSKKFAFVSYKKKN